MKLVDIVEAKLNGAVGVIARIRVPTANKELRRKRRLLIEEIDRESLLAEQERKACMVEVGLDPEKPIAQRTPAFEAGKKKFEEYLDNEAELKPEPLFRWEEITEQIDYNQELSLMNLGVMFPERDE